jgi:hypothetical protein
MPWATRATTSFSVMPSLAPSRPARYPATVAETMVRTRSTSAGDFCILSTDITCAASVASGGKSPINSRAIV